jgi:hypothetical protein
VDELGQQVGDRGLQIAGGGELQNGRAVHRLNLAADSLALKHNAP